MRYGAMLVTVLVRSYDNGMSALTVVARSPQVVYARRGLVISSGPTVARLGIPVHGLGGGLKRVSPGIDIRLGRIEVGHRPGDALRSTRMSFGL